MAIGAKPSAVRAGRLAVLGGVALCAAAPIAAFDLQGHRGARGLAPENTLAAFGTALEAGVSTIETDLAVTRDGVVVISHDPRLDPALVRGPDGSWLTARGPAIRSLSLAELKAYDIGRLDPASAYAKQWPQQRAHDGERFPTLAELFDLVRSRQARVKFNLETKITPGSGDEVVDPRTFVELAVAEIRRAGVADRTTLQSFDWRTLRIAKRIAPDIRTSCLTARFPNFDTVTPDATGRSSWQGGLDPSVDGPTLPRLVKAAGCAIWSPNAASLTSALVGEAHALGLDVLPWTVNDPVETARLIELGVDGLITDYPDRARRLLVERGLAID
jgi:glycerophosphoryl diester phosphodiesterase